MSQIRDVLSLLASAAVITGVLIALSQLRDLRRMRQMELAMQLFDRFDDAGFQRQYQRISRWTYDDLETFERRATEDDWVDLYSISAYFENMGLLYKRKLAPIDLLDDIMSGPLTIAWRIVGPIWIEYRAKYDRPMMAEHFEFLATDMEKRLAKFAGRAKAKKDGPAPVQRAAATAPRRAVRSTRRTQRKERR